ncbi:conserved hypothetical protein [Chloroherpeton thalassium ATCC 35110]|uniref:GAF domain-containing protein n=1 Tax=Chloroherpeton thalassium (strain ATCC 35110 / GB-78) TaxID=517418 RepID=B3QX08_CHLT3|nr:GAF domain-containing protein [Chloroherpeton thalassium]ACF14818.1 conserved hypothetical protein [Chloroherpeton thalassium ATCC 35110]
MNTEEMAVSLREKLQSIKLLPNFPFKTVLNFNLLIQEWYRAFQKSDLLNRSMGEALRQELDLAPELRQPIYDLSLVEKHRELIDALFLLAFPHGVAEHDYTAAFVPFTENWIYESPSYKKQFGEYGGIWHRLLNLNEVLLHYGKTLRAYTYIAKRFYNLDVDFDYPIVVVLPDTVHGLDRYYKIDLNVQYVDIKVCGKFKKLSKADIKLLMANLSDLEVWLKVIPPENFEFHGFSIIKLTDVTDHEVISGLKRDLIEKESIISDAKFQSLQQKLRILLRLPDISMAMGLFQNDEFRVLNAGCKDKFRDSRFEKLRYSRSEILGTIYDFDWQPDQIKTINDLREYPNPTIFEEFLLEKQIRSLLIAPLYYQGKLIGGLEISSSVPDALNELVAIRLHEVLPLFSMAVNRTIQELNSDVQAIIKDKFTVIHPSVEWRFQEAALRLIDNRQFDPNAEIEEIVFKDVIPLFGVSDIRGSSTNRNEAIQADLIDQLELAKSCLVRAHHTRPLPILEEMIFRIDKKISLITERLSTEVESLAIDLLRREIEPLFAHLCSFSLEVKAAIDRYWKQIDPMVGVLYKKRKAFDDSVTQIADAVSSYIEIEEVKAQRMYPHYFEKHKTDGVDYGLYVGGSLVPDGQFDPIYLKNLRLWQLILMCGIARQTECMKHNLPLPLETTHLILVQSSPLSIRFRPDEKLFDVDGTYNVRYEIIKKRIDKALIKGTSERVTQPGKIAIVYSQQKEIDEYRAYINYLQSTGCITEKVEELEIEDLQGVQGLYALRITVDSQSTAMLSDEVVQEAMTLLN